MERMIALLREKNLYLEKFFTMNQNELVNFADGCFDNVESFYNARDKVLDLIRAIDGLIDEESRRAPAEIPMQIRQEIDSILKAKDEWVTSILAQDLQVLSCIEKEKSNIIRELQATRRARKAVGAYHSGERARQLNEKA